MSEHHASVLPTPHPWGCPRRSPHLLLRLPARPPARVDGAVWKGRGLRLLRGTWLVPWVTHGIKAWPPRGADVSWRGRGAGPGAARAWRAPEGLRASSTVQVGTALPPWGEIGQLFQQDEDTQRVPKTRSPTHSTSVL